MGAGSMSTGMLLTGEEEAEVATGKDSRELNDGGGFTLSRGKDSRLLGGLAIIIRRPHALPTWTNLDK